MNAMDELERLRKEAREHGLEVTDGTYKSVLAKELTEEKCRSFSGAREWAMSEAWRLIKEEGYRYLDTALDEAWRRLREKCTELGVPRIAGKFPKGPFGGQRVVKAKPIPKQELKRQIPEKERFKPPKGKSNPQKKEKPKPKVKTGLFRGQMDLDRYDKRQKKLNEFENRETLEKLHELEEKLE